jgi:hypothetical protein
VLKAGSASVDTADTEVGVAGAVFTAVEIPAARVKKLAY